MDYLSHNVAVNLKQIRQSKGMSLGEVAEQTGVSKSMLAQIEKGTANPSLGVLGKITSGLRIEFQTLIDPPREDFCLVNPKEIIPTKELEGQYKVWTCFPYEDSHSVEVYRIDIEPGGVYMTARHGRTGTTLGRRIRSGQSRRPKCPDHSLCDCRIGYFGSFLPDIFHQNAEKRR